MNKPARNAVLLLPLFGMLVLAGCAGGIDDLRNFVEAEKAKKPGPIESLPQIQPYESFTYNARDLRSPFMPDTPVTAPPSGGGEGGGLRPDPNRNREYLESFPLDALEMVGTITMRDQDYALVQDPEGAVHPVQPGNYLGQNHGKIGEITPLEVRLIEIIPDGLGGWIERQASIALGE